MTLGVFTEEFMYRKFLHNVNRIDDVYVGCYVASDGSWQRKGQIMAVAEIKCPPGTKAKIRSGCSPVELIPVMTCYKVRVKTVGRYWADGRYEPVRRPAVTTKTFWRMLDGRLIQESGWVPVYPTSKRV